MFKRPARFRMERLEDRRMMAGDVTARLSNGNLELTEADGQVGADNVVYISQLPSGKLRVSGTIPQSNGPRSLINGAAYQDFDVRGVLNVKLGGGGDVVMIKDIRSSVPPFVTAMHVELNGPDAAGLPKRDSVWIENVVAPFGASIKTGAGDDAVTVFDSQFGASNYGGFTVATGAGADNVWVAARNGTMDAKGYCSLNLGDDADQSADKALVQGLMVHTDLSVKLGGGADRLDMTRVEAGRKLYIEGGSGDDQLNINDVDVNGSQGINVHLQAGNDTLNMFDVWSESWITVGDTTGDDVVAMTAVAAREQIWADLGAGNDRADLLHVNAKHLHFDGGAGYDRLKRQYVASESSSVTNWEEINGRRIPTFGSATFALAPVGDLNKRI